MPDKREKDLFIVSDKRKFTAEGELKDDTPAVEERTPESRPAEEPKVESAKPQIEKTAELSPEEAAKQPREVPEPPSAEAQSAQHADYKEAGRQVDEMLKEHGAPAEAFQETTFEQLVMSLYMSAMMQLGAVRPEGQPPAPPDVMGARRTVDTLGILQEKTKGNVSDRESNLLQHILFELRMTYVEVIRLLSQAPPDGPVEKKTPGGIVTPGGPIRKK